MPPLTRNRAGRAGVATDLMAVYYVQRASAGLTITEGIPISPEAIGYPGLAGLWLPEQARSWRLVTNAVHAAGGLIFAQLWHVGRVSHSSNQPGQALPVAPSAVAVGSGQIYTRDGLKDFETPRPLRTEEVGRVVGDYATAARNALLAGFDGVELHAANGYLIDQFLNDNINLRTDEYGGTAETRSRLLFDVVHALAGVWGADRVGVRLSPSGTWMNCRDSDQRALYSQVVERLSDENLAYLHLIEPEMNGDHPETPEDAIPTSHFRSLYRGTLIVAGAHSRESGNLAVGTGAANAVGFGRLFIANPDLPERFAAGAPLQTAARRYFYGGGETGYTDYPSLADEARYDLLCSLVRTGALTHDQIADALAGPDPLSQVPSGDYYARLRFCGISDGPPTE